MSIQPTEPSKPLGITDDEVFRITCDNYRQCLSWAEDYGVGINIETHGPYTTNGDFLERLFRHFDSPYLRLNFDTGNTFISGNDPLEYLKRFPPLCRSLPHQGRGGRAGRIASRRGDRNRHQRSCPRRRSQRRQYSKMRPYLKATGWSGVSRSSAPAPTRTSARASRSSASCLSERHERARADSPHFRQLRSPKESRHARSPPGVAACRRPRRRGRRPKTPASQRPVRVLIVTGVDHPAHNWKATAPALSVSRAGRAAQRATIVEDPDVLATEDVFKYDVVVLHFRNEKPLAHESQARANLERLVKEGRGLVLIHFACGAFGDWPGFGELAGMVWDGKNTHDPRGPFDVRIVDSHHPVTPGLTDFRTDDELYIGLDQRPVEVLAMARSKVTGRDHPMAFAFAGRQGPRLPDSSGPRRQGAAGARHGDLIRRGCQWAARRPIPAQTRPGKFLTQQ